MSVNKRPNFSLSSIEALALEHYGLVATAKALPSERDQNCKLETKDGKCYVLKIAHPDESRELLELENLIMAKLGREVDEKIFPSVLPSLQGEDIVLEDEKSYLVRLISYLPGEVLANVVHPSSSLLNTIGKTVGKMDKTLATVEHPAMYRDLQWDAKTALETVRQKLLYIKPSLQGQVMSFLISFAKDVQPQLASLPQSLIHNDLNDYNVLVKDERLSGIFDFGDALYSYRVNELAILCAYAMMNKDNPLEVAAQLVKGYMSSHPLDDTELSVLYPFVLLRLYLSVSLSAYQQRLEPDKPYLSISEKPAWDLLDKLKDLDAENISSHLLASL